MGIRLGGEKRWGIRLGREKRWGLEKVDDEGKEFRNKGIAIG